MFALSMPALNGTVPDMTTTSTYRVTMTDQAGTEHITWVTSQDEIDALTDQHETRDSAYPAGTVERQRKDGTWTTVGGWDVRPRTSTPTTTRADYTAERNAEMAAVAAANAAHDRRENRRSYYLRTGR